MRALLVSRARACSCGFYALREINDVERRKHHLLKDPAASVCGSGDGLSPSVTNSSGSVVSDVAAP